MRVHFVVSPFHYYCEMCDLDFRTPAGRRLHVETSPNHADEEWEAPNMDEFDIDRNIEGWEDRAGAIIYPGTNALAKKLNFNISDHYTPRDEYWPEDGLEYSDDATMVAEVDIGCDDLELEEEICPCNDFSSAGDDISGLSDINTEDITESVYDLVDRQISKEFRDAIRRDTVQTPNGGQLVVLPMLEISPEEMANLCPIYIGALPMDPVMQAGLEQDERERALRQSAA